MLTSLSVHQFALVDHMELEFDRGMTVITGETGAGKSILLDALGLALGNRADAGCVRHGEDKADISASFMSNAAAAAWLESRDIPAESEVILRRVVSSEGRSRGYINNRPVSAADLRELATRLIDVHSQHAHQHLLSKETPREILDAYAGLRPLAEETSGLYRAWQKHARQLKTLSENSSELLAQRQLLEYQVEELRQLAPSENELEELETEHKRLANAEHTLLSGQHALVACSGDDNSDGAASQLVYRALQELENIDDAHPLLAETRDLLTQAQIQLDEASRSLQHYLDHIDINPHRLQQVESRLSDIYSTARKHQISPAELHNYWQSQEEALAGMALSDEDLEAMAAETERLKQAYLKQAEVLSQQRSIAAQTMDSAIESHFASLALGKARFATRVTRLPDEDAAAHGLDEIVFEVQTNPGMPWGTLAKVASGGELSRISLAIQVVTAATCGVPSLIFDEVDVGIGGGTAERVGRLMRSLGEHTQIMCVTHQPQVAAQAHQHYQVSKVSGDTATHTRIRELQDKQRQEELARMLGGVEITSQTLAHAEEMLALAGNK